MHEIPCWAAGPASSLAEGCWRSAHTDRQFLLWLTISMALSKTLRPAIDPISRSGTRLSSAAALRKWTCGFRIADESNKMRF